MRTKANWKQWIKDMRALQKQCAADGYQMLVDVKLIPAKKPRKKVKP